MNSNNMNKGVFKLFFKNFAHIPHINKIYHEWALYNVPIYVKYFILVSSLIFAFCIPLDFIWFASVEPYISWRILFIVLMFVLFVLYDRYGVRKYITNKSVYSINIYLLIPGLFANAIYLYYLIQASQSDYIIVLLANFFVIIISTLFMYRFWKEQYVLNGVMIFFCLTISFFKVDIVQDLIRLVYFHVISFSVAFYYRNQFLDNLYKRFIHISSLVPMQIAKYYTISEGRENLEDIFQSEERFTVCLCSDWRNYQKFADNHKYDELSNFIEIFYDIIFDKLELLFPEGEYYTDWTADELFIVFYGNEKNKTDIINKSLKFAHSLSTDIYLTISSRLDIDLFYDIGLSAGLGYLGLQGPNRFKKTTITGKPAIIAKRLESTGKTLRQLKPSHSFPHLLLDEHVYDIAKQNSLFNKHSFDKVKIDNEELKDINAYNWQFQD